MVAVSRNQCAIGIVITSTNISLFWNCCLCLFFLRLAFSSSFSDSFVKPMYRCVSTTCLIMKDRTINHFWGYFVYQVTNFITHKVALYSLLMCKYHLWFTAFTNLWTMLLSYLWRTSICWPEDLPLVHGIYGVNKVFTMKITAVSEVDDVSVNIKEICHRWQVHTVYVSILVECHTPVRNGKFY